MAGMPPQVRIDTRRGVVRFALVRDGKPKILSMKLGEVRYIGRGSICVLIVDDLQISSKHVELSVAWVATSDGAGRLSLQARDNSRNGTGIRDAPHQTEIRPLSYNNAEELRDGMELILPFKPSGPLETSFGLHIEMPPRSQPEQPEGLQKIPKMPAVKPHAAAAPKQVLADNYVAKSSSQAAASASGKYGSGKKSTVDTSQLPDVYEPLTGTGRWRYIERLGEGGLGVVYKAFDETGKLGEVAVKVHKPRSKNTQKDARFIFEMHRECQWSKWWLHNEWDAHYNSEASKLFGRYLEDHTGFTEIGAQGFDDKRKMYEAPDFDWEKNGPQLPQRPYVVMELVSGEALHVAIDREFDYRAKPGSRLTSAEKRGLLLQAARALEYLEPFGLIHRDFRGCNMHVFSSSDGRKHLKVLDLGIMICASDGEQALNKNKAVQAFQKRGETEEKRQRYDWLPWEIRGSNDGTPSTVNFVPPTYTYDVFSLGVLMLHMLIGRSKARAFLASLRENPRTTTSTAELGIDSSLLLRMLGQASERPHPSDIVKEFLKATDRWPAPDPSPALDKQHSAIGAPTSSGAISANANSLASLSTPIRPNAKPPAVPRGSRSRSRSRDRGASHAKSRANIAHRHRPPLQPSVNPPNQPVPVLRKEPKDGLGLPAALCGYSAMARSALPERAPPPLPPMQQDEVGYTWSLRYFVGPAPEKEPEQPAIGGLYL